MIPRVAGFAAVLALAVIATTASAQTPLMVPGVRVRVTGPCQPKPTSGLIECAVVVGRLRSWGADSVILQEGHGTAWAVAQGEAARIEVSDGRKSHKLLGLTLGGAAGLGFGVLTPCRSTRPADRDLALGYVACTWLRLLTVPLFTGLGMSLGRIVGGLIESERWLDLPRKTTALHLVPHGSAGVALVLSVRF